MVSGILVSNRKCPNRAGVGHMKNTQVPCILGLVVCLNAVRALRALITTSIYSKKHFTRVVVFSSALSALTLFLVSRRPFLALFTCPSKCPRRALNCYQVP